MKYFLALFMLLSVSCFAQTPDPSKWYNMNEFSPRNSEAECYSPGQNTEPGNIVQTAAAIKTSCTGGSSPYASGELESVFSFTYGTVKYTAKFAGGTGTWPAIWLLGSKCQPTKTDSTTPGCPWPAAGSNEIDITEIKNQDFTSPFQNVINPGGTWYSCRPVITDVSTNFHNYSLVWTATSLVWSIDGVVTCTAPTNNNFIPSTPMFLILNIALGGAGGGTINNSTLPQTNVISALTVEQNGVIVFNGLTNSTAPDPPTNLKVTTK